MGACKSTGTVSIARLLSDEAVEAAQDAYDEMAERLGFSPSDGDCLLRAISTAIERAK